MGRALSMMAVAAGREPEPSFLLRSRCQGDPRAGVMSQVAP